MKKIMVLGNYGYGVSGLDGQVINTINIYNLILKHHPDQTRKVDTLEHIKRPWKIFPLLFNLLKIDTLIIIPGQNCFIYFLPLCYFLSKMAKFNIICICVGGWQYEFFAGKENGHSHRYIMNICRKIKCFMPELQRVNNDLIEHFNFKNTKIFPNFKEIPPLPAIQNRTDKQLKIVFCARINKNKGFHMVFDAIKSWKDKFPFHVTFYGDIENEDRKDFFTLIEINKKYASYNGLIPQNKVHVELAKHDILVLPTKYYTEGFPGSILDAYIAGIPVVVTEWKHSHEFVVEDKTGFIVPFTNGQSAFEKKIESLFFDQAKLSKMKKAARKESLKYSDKIAWDLLKDLL